MKSSFHMSEFQENFKKSFSEISIEHYTTAFGEKAANVFHIKIDSEERLKNNWKQISNFIAMNFQRHLEDEFEQFNIYLFYDQASPVSKELKYNIENDLFSSRKIVITEGEDFNKILDDYVVNSLSSFEHTQTDLSIEYSQNAVIKETLFGKKLRKKNKTSEANAVYHEILKKFKNEV